MKAPLLIYFLYPIDTAIPRLPDSTPNSCLPYFDPGSIQTKSYIDIADLYILFVQRYIPYSTPITIYSLFYPNISIPYSTPYPPKPFTILYPITQLYPILPLTHTEPILPLHIYTLFYPYHYIPFTILYLLPIYTLFYLHTHL